MGMVAIWVMWPGLFKQSFIPPSHGGSIWNLPLIGQVVSEEKMFKEYGRRQMDNAACLYYISPMSLKAQLAHMWANKY